jgi:archaellum biogenesis ATPase FlaH
MREFTISQDDKRIILTLSPSRTYRENTLQMIRAIQKENLQIILICVNQPAAFLMDFYQRNGIDTRGIFFIDAITQYAAGRVTESYVNCRIIAKPNDLTEIGIAVSTTLKKFEKEKAVIFLDSVNAMLIHSSSADLLKFIHYIISKLRIMSIAGVLLAVEKGLDPVLLSQITTFADELIEFPEKKPE